ncbi:MAG: 4-hydroxy-tetrahydrodipicolinate synthase [Vicinamibacterales bacterium]
MRVSFTGLGTALITPFTAGGALDEGAVRRLAARQVEAGVHFLVPCGTTGEAPTLSMSERVRLVELVVDEVEGHAMVMAGAGGYDTREVIQAVRAFQDVGAHGILSVTPYYNRPTQDGLYQHYRAIADTTKLPIMVYNVPGRTGCNVEPSTLARLAQIPNIIGVKEASGNMTQMTEICRLMPPEFIVLSGDDALALPLMAIGGRGLISVASNEVPAEMVELIEAAEHGDYESARRWHHKMLPLMQMNFVEANPIPVKFAMAAMGLCEEIYRLPMTSPSAASQEKIVATLKDYGMPVVIEARA